MQQFKKYSTLFMVGGISYCFIEVLWRGYSHLSMFFLAGLCFILIGNINEHFSWEMKLWKQQLIATIIITVLEFITGYIVNIKLGWNVWDYSNLRYNLLGQVCLLYSILWFFLSALAIILDDYLRYRWFDEEFKGYKL